LGGICQRRLQEGVQRVCHYTVDERQGQLPGQRLPGQRIETIRQAKDETIALPLWYNQTRIHLTLGYACPVEFETEGENALAKAAASVH
jgi:aminoglycoside phosphotransferase